MTIEYHVNRATEIQIEEHLKLCEANFIPPLSERVELQGYSKKIVDNMINQASNILKNAKTYNIN